MSKQVKIEGMSCMHCVKHVENALSALEGVESFKVEVGSAVVEGNVSDEALKNAIEEEGYDVVSIA
ncbi:cation transporter [Clostridium sp. YIM B02505]|jgi:copper chaperone CopZ|uniref:Copper chaperone CopZ n=2 Tax=Clostridium TaxID=1485 RepID=A0A6V8SJ91_9CLOT|nr:MULTISPECIES: cation transporter [Clostridium]MBK1811374.1 cation transporter [Clostridium yunnanense]GFP77289.1 Copper chaperone CopZ [Clostridium fungisolvens]